MARTWNARSVQKLSSEDTKRKCPECSSEDIVNEKGEIFCKKCGFILSD